MSTTLQPTAGAAVHGTGSNGPGADAPSNSATPMSSADRLKHVCSYPTIKHIPRSARPHCARQLSSAISAVLADPDNTDKWQTLLCYSSIMLAAPPRAGRRHNIAAVLKRRSMTDEPNDSTMTHIGRKKRNNDTDATLEAAVRSKIEDGNVKAALRILCSDDRVAPVNDSTVTALRDRHPPAPSDRLPVPDPHSYTPAQVTEEEVAAAIRSFPAGSAGGPDGLRPQHLRDLIANQETGSALLTAITGLVNILLSGKCPPQVAAILFGGKLVALQKKCGGVRPIAVGYTWRRLAAKCANRIALAVLGDSLLPIQLGVGVSGGCEAAVHAARRLLAEMPDDWTLVKIDFSNAFNCLRRDTMLEAVADRIPQLYKFCHLAYSQSSVLWFGEHILTSEEGAQQGDPLGPLLFCLSIHPLLLSLGSPLRIAYMDDVTLAGPSDAVSIDVASIRQRGIAYGLQVNDSKSEIIAASSTGHNNYAGFVQLTPDTCTLLGAPLSRGSAMDECLVRHCENLERAIDRLHLIAAHDALVLLKNSLSAPRLLFTLRAAHCSGNPLLERFDSQLRSAVGKICNVDLTEGQWLQASFPTRYGGLGVRSVVSLAPSAFLASAAATANLQAHILQSCPIGVADCAFDKVSTEWSCMTGMGLPADIRQRSFDESVVKGQFDALLCGQPDAYHKARLRAAACARSGDWLHALPITSCGLRLSDDDIRVAVGLRLGCRICEPHCCPCGAAVDASGSHGLSCRRSAGRVARHQYINDILWRAMHRANIPAVKEPTGLSRTDGKRPDGMTMVPWQEGRAALWDVTVRDTLADSYIASTSLVAGSAAEEAARQKEVKYSQLTGTYLFYAVALETLGPMCESGRTFISELGRRTAQVTSDQRETQFLFQRISVAVQRYNSVCIAGTFTDMALESADRA